MSMFRLHQEAFRESLEVAGEIASELIGTWLTDLDQQQEVKAEAEASSKKVKDFEADAIRNWQLNGRRIPEDMTVEKIAEELGISVAELTENYEQFLSSPFEIPNFSSDVHLKNKQLEIPKGPPDRTAEVYKDEQGGVYFKSIIKRYGVVSTNVLSKEIEDYIQGPVEILYKIENGKYVLQYVETPSPWLRDALLGKDVKIADLNKPDTFWKKHRTKIQGFMVIASVLLGAGAVGLIATGVLSPLGIGAGILATKIGAAVAIGSVTAETILIPMLATKAMDYREAQRDAREMFKSESEKMKPAEVKGTTVGMLTQMPPAFTNDHHVDLAAVPAADKEKRTFEQHCGVYKEKFQENLKTGLLTRIFSDIPLLDVLPDQMRESMKLIMLALEKIDTENQFVLADENEINKLKGIVKSLMYLACESLLDDAGNLKEDWMKSAGLSDLYKQYNEMENIEDKINISMPLLSSFINTAIQSFGLSQGSELYDDQNKSNSFIAAQVAIQKHSGTWLKEVLSERGIVLQNKRQATVDQRADLGNVTSQNLRSQL